MNHIEQQKIGEFVNQNVHANVTDIVNELMEAEKIDLFECMGEPKAEYDGEEYTEEETNKLIDEINDQINDIYVKKENCEYQDLKDQYDEEIEVLEDEISELENLEYDNYPEPLEYWIVSDYLANQLREKGEVIIDGYMSNIWGRQTSGQAIFLDGVIVDIARELDVI